MRLFVALVSLLGAVALTAGSSSTRAATRTPTPVIVGYQVQPGGAWTNPDTHLTYRQYTITIAFTHQRGEIGVQANEYAAANNALLSKDAGTIMERTSGTDALSVQVTGGLVGQAVYFKLFLFKPGTWAGKPPVMKGEVIYDTETTGTYRY